MRKKTVIILSVVAGILILIVGGIAIAIQTISKNMEKELASTVIRDVDLSTIADGTYHGAHSIFPVSVEVEVTVLDHAITNVEITKHDNGQGAPAEALADTVVQEQKLTVDVVTGATTSSKTILKAVENALSSAENH